MIEWGFKYRLKKSQVTGKPGNWTYAPCESRTDAELDLAHFNADESLFEAGLAWHTAGVLPGEWQDYVPGTPEAKDDAMSPQVLSDLLLLVSSQPIPPEVIALWTVDEREVAGQWAAAEHLSASDNPVKRMPKPNHVERAEEICASPVQAQLALEAWAGRNSESAWMMNPASVARMAREALTGLVVLMATRWPASVPE